MSEIKLINFRLEANDYVGTIVNADKQNVTYENIYFIHRVNREQESFKLEYGQNGEATFRICVDDVKWVLGEWDAYLTDGKTTESEQMVPVFVDKDKYNPKAGILGLDTIYYASKARSIVPYINYWGKFTIKLAGQKNARIRHDVISCDDYDVVDGHLLVKGMHWPDIHFFEKRLVVERYDLMKRYEFPIERDEDLDYDLNDVIADIRKDGVFDQWNIWVETNIGYSCTKYNIVYKKKEPKPILTPLEIPLPQWMEQDTAIMLHSKISGKLRIAFDTTEELLRRFYFAAVTKFSMKKGLIRLRGYINCYGGNLPSLRVKYRNDQEDTYFDFPVKELKREGTVIYYETEFDLNQIEFKPFFWDIGLVVYYHGREFMARTRPIPRRIKTRLTKYLVRYAYDLDDDYVVFPYLTADFSISMQYREKHAYDKNKYRIKETLAVWIYKATQLYWKRKQIWLVCEKFSETAQDNGYYFFDYCYNNHKERKVYFIIKKDSPDYAKLRDKKDRVMPFMSFRHLIYLQMPETILVSSETPVHYYVWKIGRGRMKIYMKRRRYVFLQHGVIGLKIVENLDRGSANSANLFVTSSDFEKQIILDNFGYANDEVIVSGLARWDAYENKQDQTERKEIVLMPTWRTWLEGLTDEQFMESDYFRNYEKLLKDQNFIRLISDNNLQCNFIIHPKLKQYVSNFVSDNKNITIYQFGEVPINEMLMRSSMLVTDYSSVAWEIYRSKKPVVFFKFDLEKFEELQGSYIPSNEEVVGDATYDVDQLVDTIRYYVENGFEEKEKFAKDRSHYFKYIDRNNSKRIYDAIAKKYDVY